MHIKVRRSTLSGMIEIPPSKSQTLRAILFASLAQGKSTIYRYLDSPDTDAMIKACRLLGATIMIFKDRLEVVGRFDPSEGAIDAGNSGLVLRLVGAVCALSNKSVKITGDTSICTLRPVQPLIEGLNQLGASALSLNGNRLAPILIKGPLKGGRATIDGSDSQPVSGLLIASAFSSAPTDLHITNPGEKPWVDLTLNWFDKLGIPYKREGHTRYLLPGKAIIHGFEYTVPSDWSSAAYPVVAALITGSKIALTHLDIMDAQGDKNLIYKLQEMGANIVFDSATHILTIDKSPLLKGITIDVNNFIDGITILAVVGCFAQHQTEIIGGCNARFKESDRIKSIITELKKMGANIEETIEGFIVRPSYLKGAIVVSHDDHRIALSLSTAALAAEGETTIQNADCIQKSYKSFLRDFKILGAQIE
jgi:3-phosphoshikimate 1-carboxyvinyltransferase